MGLYAVGGDTGFVLYSAKMEIMIDCDELMKRKVLRKSVNKEKRKKKMKLENTRMKEKQV